MSRRFSLFLAVLLLCVAGGFFMFSKTNNFDKVDSVEISGVKVPLIFEPDSSLPRGVVRLVFDGGGKIYDEQNGVDSQKYGLSNIVALIFDEGTMSLGSAEFAEQLESKAVDLEVGAGLKTLSFEISFLSEFEDYALNHLMDLLKDPNLNALDKAKTLYKASLDRKQNNFDTLARENLESIFFANSALAHHATKQSIDDITQDDIKKYLSQNLVLERLVIVAGGDFKLQDLKAKLQKILSFLQKGQKVQMPQIHTLSDSEISTQKRATEKQSYVHFAAPFNAPQDEYYKTKVASFILGGSGFGSRIMEEVRVKRGLAYSAYLSIVGNSNLVNYAIGYLQTDTQKTQDAIDVVRDVVLEFVKNGATQDELDSAKAFILGSEPLTEETLSKRLNARFGNFMNGLALDSQKRDNAKIANLTLEELNDFIRSHTELQNLTFSVITQE